MVPHDWSGNPSPRQDPGDSTESDLESVAADSDPGSDHASDEGLGADPMDSNPTSVQNPLGLPGSGQDSNNTPESVNADPDDSSETIDLGQQLDQLDGLNDEQFSPSGSISEIMANFHAASTSGYGPLNINSSLFALGAGNQPGVGLSSQLAQSAPAVGFRDLRKRGNGPSQVSNRLLRPPYDLERLANQVVDRKMPKLVQLPFNTLQTTEGAIHIFSDIQYRTDEQSRAKVAPHLRVMAHGALHQRLTNAQHHGDHPQRLNMIHQIPELGVILVGNQAGRVGILTATRFEELKQSGYNFEYILPFKSQRDLKLQPSAPLMGIAVGPIQGQENRPEPGSTQDVSGEGAPRPEIRWNPPRRFRLLMVYKDHAVFSYEISRPTGDDILGV